MTESYVPLLRTLTEKLIGSPYEEQAPHATIGYPLHPGVSEGYALYVKPEKIAIQRNFMPAETTFPLHRHTELEWIIVYEGELVMKVGDTPEQHMRVGDGICVAIGAPHMARTLTDSWCIAITVPPSKGYPGVNDNEPT
jgi:quercetin dioxygenase-like cupin family protein